MTPAERINNHLTRYAASDIANTERGALPVAVALCEALASPGHPLPDDYIKCLWLHADRPTFGDADDDTATDKAIAVAGACVAAMRIAYIRAQGRPFEPYEARALLLDIIVGAAAAASRTASPTITTAEALAAYAGSLPRYRTGANP